MPPVPIAPQIPMTPVTPAVNVGLFGAVWAQQHPVPPPQIPAPVPQPPPGFIQVLRNTTQNTVPVPYVDPTKPTGNSMLGTASQTVYHARTTVEGGGESPLGEEGPPGLAEIMVRLSELTPEQRRLVSEVNQMWISSGWQGLFAYWKATHLEPFPFPQWKWNLMAGISAHAKMTPQERFNFDHDFGALAADRMHHPDWWRGQS